MSVAQKSFGTARSALEGHRRRVLYPAFPPHHRGYRKGEKGEGSRYFKRIGKYGAVHREIQR